MPSSPHHLLLTGVPGVGKTTVIRRVAEALSGTPLGGFYTEEIRSSGVRQGFCLRSFDGRERLIAHVEFPMRYRVGKYGVDIAAIDTAAEALLAPRAGLAVYLVDEIGKMECLSARFVDAMQDLLHSDKRVVATIGKRGGGFIDEVKQRSDCLLWEITTDNRESMPQRVLDWLKELRSQRGLANVAARLNE